MSERYKFGFVWLCAKYKFDNVNIKYIVKVEKMGRTDNSAFLVYKAQQVSVDWCFTRKLMQKNKQVCY